jgi:hypothetical protein
VVCEERGWNPHATFSSPALGVSDTSSTLRWFSTSAVNRTLPCEVVTVPDSSACSRSSVQSTPVIDPANVSVRYPIGSRE